MDTLALYTAIAWMPAVAIYGLWGVKYMSQRWRDRRYRPCSIITLPAQGIKSDRLNAYLATLHGNVSTSKRFASNAPTTDLEQWSAGGVKTIRIRVPAVLEEELVNQLHQTIPGIRVDSEKKPPRKVWTSIQEFRMKNKRRGLQPESAEDCSRRISNALNAVGPDEVVCVQWVITGAGRKALPVQKETERSKFSIIGAIQGGKADTHEVADLLKKASEPNFKCTLRIAAVADTQERADQLVARVRNALAPTGTAYTYFVPRFMPRQQLQERMDIAAGSTSWPIELSISELGRVCGIPVDSEPGVGYTPGRGMDLPPTAEHGTEGIILGHASYPGQHSRPVALSYDAARMHTFLEGATGTGKSEMIASMVRQIVRDRYAFILFEKAGDVSNKILDYLQMEQFENTIYWDMSDYERPIPFNPLDQQNRAAAVDAIMALLTYKFGERDMGPWAKEGLYHSFQTIADTPGLSFVDVLALLNPKDDDERAWARSVTGKLTDPELKRWWETYYGRNERDLTKRAEPVESRMWQFISRREVRHIIGQSKSAFTWDEILRGNKNLIVSFKGVPDESVGMLCAMLMQSLWASVKALGTTKQRPTFLVLDEAAEFMDIPVDLEKMFQQARKHNLPLILATQELEQFKATVKGSGLGLQRTILNNARNKIIFNSPDDATTLRKYMAIPKDEYITMLPDHHAVVRLVGERGITSPVTIQTLPPDYELIKRSLAAEIQEQSRRLYGRPVHVVKEEIDARRKPPERPRGPKRPRPEGFGDL